MTRSGADLETRMRDTGCLSIDNVWMCMYKHHHDVVEEGLHEW
jgi:hypothetical protein